MQISQSCCMHDEKLILYCKDHENPCCGKCVVESHKHCKEIVSLDVIIKNAKTSVSFHETEDTLTELIENVRKLRNVHQDNLTDLSKKIKAIELEIQRTRLLINKHLDKIQKNLIDEIHRAGDKESEKIRLSIKSSDEMEHCLSEYQMKIVNIKKYASDIQAFMAIKRIETGVAKEEECLLSYIPEEKLNYVTISCKMSEPIQAFLGNTKTFGEVVIETKPRRFTLSRKKSMQAQMMLPKIQSMSIENITARLHQRVDTESKNVRGCCILPNENMVFACFDKKSLTFAYVETFQDLIYYTNTNTDDVTCCDMKGTVKWKFAFQNMTMIPLGITIDNTGNVYVTTGNNNVIVISPDGKRYKELLSSRDGLRNPIALYFDRRTNKLLVSNRSGDAVIYDIVQK
ncbi:unnamed protein product [Mytilus coruscus]|uniref:B box-type domain-containing protein n=1 Tax=Mytilus coruscus TaxID=42192 RepID=A0A6J8EZX1_MYTCO|nr:unnamed protein product [Mytilus coruscus]